MEILEADSADYKVRQSREEIEYAREYEKWIRSLPPDERAQLAKRGLDKPSIPGYSSGTGWSSDVGENAIAEEPINLDSEITEEVEQTANEKLKADIRVADALNFVISELVTTPNALLTAEVLAMVCGIAYLGNTQTEIAARHGITRAAVSKRCVEMSERLGVTFSRALRGESAREAYRAAQLESHRRRGSNMVSKKIPTRETMLNYSQKTKVLWRRLCDDGWHREASPAEMLVALHSLRPVLKVANEITAMIRRSGDRRIIRELDHDLAGHG